MRPEMFYILTYFFIRKSNLLILKMFISVTTYILKYINILKCCPTNHSHMHRCSNARCFLLSTNVPVKPRPLSDVFLVDASQIRILPSPHDGVIK